MVEIYSFLTKCPSRGGKFGYECIVKMWGMSIVPFSWWSCNHSLVTWEPWLPRNGTNVPRLDNNMYPGGVVWGPWRYHVPSWLRYVPPHSLTWCHSRPNTTGCRNYLCRRGYHGKCAPTSWLGTQLYLWHVVWWFGPSYHFSDLKSSWQLVQTLVLTPVGMCVGLPHGIWTNLYYLLQIVWCMWQVTAFRF